MILNEKLKRCAFYTKERNEDFGDQRIFRSFCFLWFFSGYGKLNLKSPNRNVPLFKFSKLLQRPKNFEKSFDSLEILRFSKSKFNL